MKLPLRKKNNSQKENSVKPAIVKTKSHRESKGLIARFLRYLSKGEDVSTRREFTPECTIDENRLQQSVRPQQQGPGPIRRSNYVHSARRDYKRPHPYYRPPAPTYRQIASDPQQINPLLMGNYANAFQPITKIQRPIPPIGLPYPVFTAPPLPPKRVPGLSLHQLAENGDSNAAIAIQMELRNYTHAQAFALNNDGFSPLELAIMSTGSGRTQDERRSNKVTIVTALLDHLTNHIERTAAPMRVANAARKHVPNKEIIDSLVRAYHSTKHEDILHSLVGDTIMRYATGQQQAPQGSVRTVLKSIDPDHFARYWGRFVTPGSTPSNTPHSSLRSLSDAAPPPHVEQASRQTTRNANIQNDRWQMFGDSKGGLEIWPLGQVISV